MGSSLEQNDPLKPKTGTGTDRDVTIAHLLAASGFASAPMDKPTVAAYSPTTNISDYFFKATNDAPASNVTPLKATESIRAAESVPISTAPPIIRSAITANLLSPEPTMIKALVAPEDPTYRNLTQTDVPPPRPVTTQAELPVLRMLKETAVVPVATQSGDAVTGGLAPVTRPEVQTRQDAPPVVNPTPLKVVEQPVQQPANNGEIRPAAVAAAAVLSPATVFTTNDSPRTVAPMPRVSSDGPVVVSTQNRNSDGTPIVAAPQLRSDGTPIVAAPQVRSDGTPIVTAPQVRSDGTPIIAAPQVRSDGTPIVTAPQVRSDGTPIVAPAQVRNDVTPLNVTSPQVRNDASPLGVTPQVRADGQVPVAPLPRATSDGPLVTTTQVRNDASPLNPLTAPGSRTTSDGSVVTTTQVQPSPIIASLSASTRNEVTPLNATPLTGAPVRSDGASINAAIQTRNDGTPINPSPLRVDTPTNLSAPATTRVEISNTVPRDAAPTREAPPLLPTSSPLTSIMAQASQSGGLADMVVRVAPANDRWTKDNVPTPIATPSSFQTTDKPAPSNVVPPSTDRTQPLPVATRSDAPNLTTSDSSRPASPLPGTVSERPSSSGLPDTISRPTTAIDPATGKIPTLPGVDNARPGVDNTPRPGVDNTPRPGGDVLRGVDNVARTTIDTTRPVVDTATRPSIDNLRPGVQDPTKPDLLPRTLPDGRVPDGRVPDGRTPEGTRTTPDGRLPDSRTPDVSRTTPDGRLPDGRTPEVPRTTPDGKPIDGLRPAQDAPRIGLDGRPVENPRTGLDGRPVETPRTTPDGRPVETPRTTSDGRPVDTPRTTPDGRPVENPRTGPDGRPVESPRTAPDGRPVETPRTTPDGRPLETPRTGPDGRTVESPRTTPDGRPVENPRTGPDGRTVENPRTGTDGRPQDGQRPNIEGRPQDGPRPNLEGRPQDGQRTTDGTGKVEPNRNINQDGIPRPTEQKNVDVPRGELGRSGANEGRTADGGKAIQDGSSKNLDGSSIRSQEPGRMNDALNTRATEQSGRIPDGIRNIEQNVSSKSIDGSQIRNPEAASTVRSENQSGKLPDSATSRTAPESIQQSASTRPGEIRAENVGNRSVEQRTDNVASRTGEQRPESIVNRTGEQRPENIANRIGEPRPDNVANRTGEPRLDNAPKPGDIRTDLGAINKNIENVPTRSTEPSKGIEIPGTKPGDVRTDVAANRLNESPIIKNADAANVRSDIQSNRPSDLVSNKLDGVANRNTDVPNTRSTDANNDAKSFDNSTKHTNSSNVRVDGTKMPDGGDVVKPTDRVGLNIDAPRQPQIQVPLNLVATQKEADAIRQVLIELKQNQHLSSSEVLQLPSFKEALRLLDSLKPKDGEANTEGKQNFTTSFVEAMRLSDFLKVLEKANEVEQKRIYKQQWAARSLSQNQRRVRYLVKKDETLESIAEKILGDVRFVQLLVTINRAEIIFTCISGKSVSAIYEGQYLWIPTPNEVEIHRKHYFNANGAAQRGEPIAAEAETPIMVEEYEAPTTVRDFATRLRSVTTPPVGAHGEQQQQQAANSPMAVVLYRLRFAGNRNSVNLDEVVETPAEDRRRYKVRLGETLQSIAVNDELMKDVNMWVLICRLNELDTAVDVVGRPRAQLNRGDIITLPNQADIEEFKLFARLMEIAELSGKKIDIDLSRKPAPAKASPLCKVDRKMSIETLAERCRMILTDNDDTSYSIKLQRDTLEGKWTTVASYESKGGKTIRWTYKIDGTKNCLEVGLPAAVSREMAIEDFQRNWRFYYNRYTAIKTDTLELLDMSEAANR